MKPLILLDVDGVLNPRVRPGRTGSDGPVLVLSDARVSLVRRLAACGQIAWVTTWPLEQTAGMETQMKLDVQPLRVTIPAHIRTGPDVGTPKLRPVDRWLSRNCVGGDSVWDTVIWIDDVLGRDAHSWADEHELRVVLVTPASDAGLTDEHVRSVEDLVRNESLRGAT